MSQKSLAARASITQSAISRIECGCVSPAVETLRDLLFVLGEDLELRAKQRKAGIDLEALEERLRLTPEERIRLALRQRAAEEGE